MEESITNEFFIKHAPTTIRDLERLGKKYNIPKQAILTYRSSLQSLLDNLTNKA